MPRYQVIDSSDSGHCCFDATVIDTATPTMIGEYRVRDYTWVCECFDKEQAEMIAEALNRTVPGD